jgi:hypothetical protein|tara:strand:- start:98 stop:1453 length:1356 start_codon:yes stop_codon:yes gene_type:complete
MSPPRLVFDLSADAVNKELRQRESQTSAAHALLQLRNELLLGQTGANVPATAPGLQPSSRTPTPPPKAHLSMRFSQPATQSQAQARPRDAITFATLLPQPKRTQAPLQVIRPVPVPTGAQKSNPQNTNPNEQCTYADQYSVYNKDGVASEGCDRCLEVAYAVLVKNHMSTHPSQKGKSTSDVLTETGHLERFSAWSHWIGALLFAIYAAVRPAVADSESVAGTLATITAWGAVFTLSSSGIYHTTAPSKSISKWTRFLDYAAIYVGLVLTSVADIAVSTRGFSNVPIETVIDIPIAGTLMVLFFLWRRFVTSEDDTWSDDNERVIKECPLGKGLFRRQHFDLNHTPLRYATSFLLAAGYFAWVPATFVSFDAPQAGLIIGLQAFGFLVLSFGMFIDRVLKWPDAFLGRGDAVVMRCEPCGCPANSHGVWHIVALISIVCTAVGREYGLAVS